LHSSLLEVSLSYFHSLHQIHNIHISPAGSTASDVENGVCAPVTLIFARGTTEQGNLGTIVGPQFADAMKAALGNATVAVQGVNYAADIPGATSGAINPAAADGAKNMVMMATTALAACPNTKVVLSGYSQGAEQVRGALIDMPAGKVAVSSFSSFHPSNKNVQKQELI
jgi:cutinase